jgi:transmembrane sensor
MHPQPSHNSLWFLIARSLAGETSLEEEQTLQHILQQDASTQQQYDLLKRMWHIKEDLSEVIDEHEKENISHILQLAEIERTTDTENIIVEPRGKRRKLFYRLSGAAAIIFLASVSWIFIHNDSIPGKKNSSAQTQTLVAEKGSKTRTILPDGSSVWLNADSHVTYSENSSANTREVKLDGEAYFDVVKDAKRPFIVHVADYDIKVLGTLFNVKSYPDDKTIETTLIRGLVQVTKHNEKKQKPIFLHPNEKLIVEKFAANHEVQLPNIQSNIVEKNYIIKPLDSSLKEPERIETAWVYNRLEFNGDNFEELAGKLERWYNVIIIFDDNAVKDLHLHGSFENETIEQALAALKIATPFNYEIHGKEIHIKSAG